MSPEEIEKLTPKEKDALIAKMSADNSAKDEALKAVTTELKDKKDGKVSEQILTADKVKYRMLYSKINFEGKIVSFEDLKKDNGLFVKILETSCGSFEKV